MAAIYTETEKAGYPTVSSQNIPKHYCGAAADTPTGVAVGSIYWAHDTNIIYKTYDGTNWVLFITLG